MPNFKCPIMLIKKSKKKVVIEVGKNEGRCCKRSRSEANQRYRAKKDLEMKLLLEKEKNSNLLEDKINSLLRERELHNAEIINLKQELAKYQNNL